MPPLILDGRALARKREPALRARAERVRVERGTAPSLLLVAFAGPDGRAPWVEGKVRAGGAVGVEVQSLVLSSDMGTRAVRDAVAEARDRAMPDAVFVQIPAPPRIDVEEVMAAVPAEMDVDAMTPGAFRAFMAGSRDTPPATVAAILALLDEGGVGLDERTGVVVGDETPFNTMLTEALARRGARMTVVAPGERLPASTVVVVCANRAGAVRSGEIAPGAVVVDGGYFNPGGVGDVDLSDGVEHLATLAPVPGGVGPMTVSALMEGVIGLAEDGIG